MYVGVHYPFDVVAGAVLGILCALIIVALDRILAKRFPGVFHVERITKAPDQADSG